MARQERPLDAADGPVAAFAQHLRDLRSSAGNPPYRELAGRAHYAATTLSEAAAGRRLPSLEVTLGYVRACGGDVDDWRRRWCLTARATGVDETEAAPLQDPSTAHAEPDVTSITADLPALRVRRVIVAAKSWSVRRQERQRAVRLAAAMAVIAGALLAAVLAGSAGPGRRPTGPEAPSPAPCVGDGADPRLCGCAAQATTLTGEPLRDRQGVRYGTLELRYARHCHSAWARYVPETGAPVQLVTISVTRSQPAGKAAFTLVVHDGPIFGDMLVITEGCVQARASVTINDITVADAYTRCTSEPA